jgi:carbon-monoxide dehydrogenase large subunit
VRVVIGTGPSGQGHETSFAQVVSSLLSVPQSAIDIVMGDTDIVTAGGGSHSGRSMRQAATLFWKAAPELIAKGKRLSARLLDCTADEVEFADGRFAAPRRNRSFDLLELARALPPEAVAELAVSAEHEMHDPVFPNGCAVCEVEIDPETGAVDLTRYSVVDDVGRCINPLIVHGQTHGGAAQGIGQALCEACVTEPGSGQPLAGTFMDYAMPRASDLPAFATQIVEVLSPRNPLGIKAGGEGGTTPAPAVIVSAILDALAPLGVRNITMPATPFAVWQAIRRAEAENV